jgi:hypothetical protein
MMRTDELIAALARNAEAIEPHALQRRCAVALCWGASGAVLLMAILLGVRPDLSEAARLPMFWMKLAFPAALFAGALFGMARLSRPGVRLGQVPAAIAAPIVAVWAMAAAVLLEAAPADYGNLILGKTWASCPLSIAMLSVPLFAALIWAIQGLAPTRLALAGAAAGLLSGAGGALVYALHCPETGAPFLAIWYLLGMLIPAFAGAWVGPRLLRW